MSSESSPLPDQTTFLRKQGRHFTADELVADRLLAVGVQLVGVCNFPGSGCVAVIVGHCFKRGSELCLLGVECVSVRVLSTSHLRFTASCVDLEDGVVGSVDISVHTQTEQMLVVVCVDSRVDFSTPALGVLAGVHGVGVQNTGELDVELDSTVLVEDPVDAVLVVGGSEDVGDDQLPATSYNDRLVTEVGVLEEDTGVFLVDTDGVLDDRAGTRTVDKGSIHVVDGALAVAAEGKTVGHVATAVLSQVESVLALMRVLRISVGDDHLCERETVEHGADISIVIEGNVVQDDTLTVVETNVDVPLLPVDSTSVDTERNTLWLSDVNGLNIRPVTTIFLNRRGVVVVGRRLADGPPDRRDIDVNDLLRFRIEDRAEVQRKRVLRIVNVGTVVHKSLLQTNTIAETLVVSDCPSCKRISNMQVRTSRTTTTYDRSKPCAFPP